MIAHIISGLGTGGAETMLCKLVSGSRESKAIVICLGEKVETKISRQLIETGAKIYWLNINKYSMGLGAILTLRKVLRIEQPSVLQGWMYHGNLATLLAACFLKQPVICWGVRHSLHDVKQDKWLTRLIIKIGAVLSGYTDKVIYNSKASQKQHEVLGYKPEKSLVIPNGFDLDVMCPDADKRHLTRNALAVEKQEILIGCIARYHPVKGHAVLLAAAKYVCEQTDNARFVLVGLGCEKNNHVLVSKIDALGLQNNFILLGERSDIVNLINAFDIVVSPSLSEAFSNTIGEAMACGVPCVVTDVGDSKWLLGEGGISVPAKNSVKLSEALCELASQPHASRVELGLTARARITAMFSMGKVVNKYKETFNQALKLKRSHLN